MKRIFNIVVLMLIVGTGLQAQDPQLTNPTIDPAPVVTDEQVELCVTLHNNSTSVIPYDAFDPVVITISTDQVSNVVITGSEGLEHYTWTVACNVPDCSDPQVASYTIRGVQNQVVPGRMTPFDFVGGQICFSGAAADTPIETSYGPTFGVGFNSNIAASEPNDVDRESTSNNQSNYTWTVDSFLPIELGRFTAEAEGVSAMLNWETITETNNDYFEVEFSTTGLADDFHYLRTEESKAIEGNSEEALNYNYEDKLAAQRAGVVYYRVKQVDFDGSYSYTPVRVVNFSEMSFGTSIFPNPVKRGEAAVLTHTEGIELVELFDLNGKVVKVQEEGGTTAVTSVGTNDLSRGLYMIVINGKETVKMIVQ